MKIFQVKTEEQCQTLSRARGGNNNPHRIEKLAGQKAPKYYMVHSLKTKKEITSQTFDSAKQNLSFLHLHEETWKKVSENPHLGRSLQKNLKRSKMLTACRQKGKMHFWHVDRAL